MKNIKKMFLMGLILVLAVSIVACTDVDNTPKDDDNDIKEVTNITIEHELDTVTLDTEPKNIIVFDYGILDALDFLDEDIIGLPKGSLPSYLEKYKGEEYTDVGTLKEPNFETIFELEPDLIFISGRQATLYDEFKKIAPTVYLSIDGGNYLNDFKHNMDILGKIFDKAEVLNEEVEKVELGIEKLNNIATDKNINALFIMANDGSLSAFGKGSRFGILHDEFGLAPADAGIEVTTHGQKISYEYILETNPDFIFVMDRAVIAGGETSAAKSMDNDLVRSTKAYENDNILYVNPYTWYVSSGGITGTWDMVNEIKAAIDR